MLATYPAISLWQPWASLWVLPPSKRPKKNDTRHWPAPQRLVGKTALVHAAKTKQGYRGMDERLHGLCLSIWGDDYKQALPLGVFVGTVVMGKPFPMREGIARYGAADEADEACGNWCAGRWAWPGHEP